MLSGVFIATKKNGDIYYRASITFRSKHISLGSFNNETDAHNAYNAASNMLKSDVIYTPEDYTDELCSTLSFNKWVSLTNFKNNGIYIKTPIYLKSSFFNYYMSMHDVLIFDVDDLFYYSNHSIMKRGNHFFIAEYGMQTNIASRYGIRNFARPGTDFCFVNGNNRDFRYENIKILNPHQGVTIEKDKHGVIYAARIHIKGNYLIGRYKTLAQAAIAYNKAIDYLSAKGISKNFEKNYIEEMSEEEYMEIYNSTDISEKIINFNN